MGTSDEIAAQFSGDERSHVVPEALELVQLVGNRPDEDALYARLRECCQLLGEQVRRTDRKSVAEYVLGSVDGRNHPLFDDGSASSRSSVM